MKTSKNNTLTKNILSGMAAVSMMLCINSCAKKHAAARSEAPMAAPVVVAEAPVVIPVENKGLVQIKRDINSNYVILINLKELEDAAKIEPASKKAYIVWMNADKQMAKNLGPAIQAGFQINQRLPLKEYRSLNQQRFISLRKVTQQQKFRVKR
jgi:hypothetical protein